MPRYAYERWDKRIEHPELEAMIQLAEYNEVKALIVLLYLTGARISEILSLRCKDIIDDYNRQDVSISIITLKQGGHLGPTGKFINFDPIKLQCQNCGEEWRPKVIDITKISRKCPKGCANKTRKPYRETRILNIDRTQKYLPYFITFWEYRCDRVGEEGKIFTLNRLRATYYIHKTNENVSPHAFRHSYCQKLADGGLNTFQIARGTGHKKPTMLEHYIAASKLSGIPIKKVIKDVF